MNRGDLMLRAVQEAERGMQATALSTMDELCADVRAEVERERDAARAEVDLLRRHLKAEQDANRKVVEKLCKAMGRWEGCWDNAAAERLALFREENK